LPRIEILEPVSNVNLERRWEYSKQESEIVSMDEGIQIDSSDPQNANAHSPRTDNLLPDSKTTSQRVSHAMKQDLPIVSTDEGIQIDSRDEQF
jgi:hypothetical protein